MKGRKKVKRDKANYVIQSVTHAFDVLEEFRGDIDELGVTDLSKKLKLHKNNVFRILATLESRGYIEQNKATENYRLGLKALELGQNFIYQMGLLKQARAILEQLVLDTGETGYISILRDKEVVYLDACEAKKTVRIVPRVGYRLPPYCTASGKCLIAFESIDELEKSLPKELKKYTKNTITDRKKFLEHLKQVQSEGFALDNEEFENEVKCAAAPIRDYTRRVVGTISISGPASRLSDKYVKEEIVPKVVKAANGISKRLGFGTAI